MIGRPRIGMRQQGQSAQKLSMTASWFGEVAAVRQLDLGGVSDLAQKKIAFGLEKRGRPVLRVTPYLRGRLLAAAQRYLASGGRLTRAGFLDAIEREALGVVTERIANAGADLRSVWAAHPLSPAYRRWKARKYPGKPMGQLTGRLLSELRSTRAFVVTRRS